MTHKERSFMVDGTLSGQTLTAVVAHFLSCSKKRAKALVDARAVYVNERRVWIASHVLRRGDLISVREEVREIAPPRRSALPVLFEDDDLLVIDKPAGLLTQGPKSAEEVLQCGLPHIRAVHRLDRDTTGCLIFAKHERARTALEALFRARGVVKRYLALVAGRLPRAALSVNSPVSGKSAHSHVKVMKYWGDTTLVEVEIETGRTHQIRRHLAGIGHPVLGDPQYGTGRVIAPWERSLARQLLHAWSIEFLHPFGGAPLKIRAPVPEDFPQVARGAPVEIRSENKNRARSGRERSSLPRRNRRGAPRGQHRRRR